MGNHYNSEWIDDFEKSFKQNNNNTNQLYIIEGDKPYKQSLDNKQFYISASKCPNNPYCNFDVIAFLVNDWIKIQDSLEMIFNLLSGGHIRSLEILAYLRKNSIPPQEIAKYLFIKKI